MNHENNLEKDVTSFTQCRCVVVAYRYFGIARYVGRTQKYTSSIQLHHECPAAPRPLLKVLKYLKIQRVCSDCFRYCAGRHRLKETS